VNRRSSSGGWGQTSSYSANCNKSSFQPLGQGEREFMWRAKPGRVSMREDSLILRSPGDIPSADAPDSSPRRPSGIVVGILRGGARREVRETLVDDGSLSSRGTLLKGDTRTSVSGVTSHSSRSRFSSIPRLHHRVFHFRVIALSKVFKNRGFASISCPRAPRGSPYKWRSFSRGWSYEQEGQKQGDMEMTRLFINSCYTSYVKA
jgi:hypothetical protein